MAPPVIGGESQAEFNPATTAQPSSKGAGKLLAKVAPAPMRTEPTEAQKPRREHLQPPCPSCSRVLDVATCQRLSRFELSTSVDASIDNAANLFDEMATFFFLFPFKFCLLICVEYRPHLYGRETYVVTTARIRALLAALQA